MSRLDNITAWTQSTSEKTLSNTENRGERQSIMLLALGSRKSEDKARQVQHLIVSQHDKSNGTWSTRRTVQAAAVANLIAQCLVMYRSTMLDSTASFTAGTPAYKYFTSLLTAHTPTYGAQITTAVKLFQMLVTSAKQVMLSSTLVCQ